MVRTKDYFADERMWALHRRRWSLSQWWKGKRLLLLTALIVVIYLLATYYEEREKRVGAEIRAHQMAYAINHAPCYTYEQPTSLILAAGSRESLYTALYNAGRMADDVRLGILISRTKEGDAQRAKKQSP